MFREVIVSTILPAIVSLLAAHAVYGIQMLTARVKAQTRKIQSEEQRVLLENALSDVEYLAGKTVDAMEQTAARELRELVHTGRCDRSELLALGVKAADDVTAAISPEAQSIIERNFGSFRDYVTKCIEAKVLELKLLERGG